MKPEEIRKRIEEAGLPEVLDVAALETLSALAEEVTDPEELMEAASEAGGGAGLFLRGAAHARSGEEEEALSPWLTLCDQLAQARAMEALLVVASRALDLGDSPGAARFLLQAAEAAGDEAAVRQRAEAILRSLPKDPRAVLAAARAREAAGGENAGALYARAFEGAVRGGADDLAEEIFLGLVEQEDRAALERGLRALVGAAARGRGEWAAPLLELGEASFRKGDLSTSLLEWSGEAIRDGADLEPLRETLARAIKWIHAGKPYLEELLKLTGIEGRKRTLGEAFQRMEELLAFPPGRYVGHHTYGVGPVLETDGERVTVDFPETGRKTMTLSMARKALTLLSRDDLRVQQALEGEALEREIAEEPASVLVRALRHLGGEGTAKQLKEVLTLRIIPERGWNSWWRKARDAALADPRVGTAEAWRDFYTLDTSGEESLPTLSPITDRRKAWKLLRRFLRDQPDREEEARAAYLPMLREWLEEELPVKLRTSVLLKTAMWTPEDQERWVKVAGGMFEAGLPVNVVSTAEEQDFLLGLGLQSDARELAAIWGLGARFAGVRERSMRWLEEQGEETLRSALRKVFAHGDAASVQFVARWYANGGEGGFGDDYSPWRLAAAVLNTLPRGETGKIERDFLELLDPEGPLARRLSEIPCSPDMYGALRMGLRSLRTHFQASHQAREFLKATGTGAALEEEAAPDAEEEESAALLAEGLLITRPTAHRLEKQAEKLKYDLQVTIPEIILRAREHGDLSENAEYKAAKEKQGLTSQKLDDLLSSLQSVRFIEDLPWEEGRILPGAEVLLQGPDGESRQVWLLGDGEGYLGSHVVSHRSPVGQALLRQREGDTVRLPSRGEEIDYRIARVTRRLPTQEEMEASS